MYNNKVGRSRARWLVSSYAILFLSFANAFKHSSTDPLTSEDRKLAIMHTQSYHPTYRTACAFFRKVSKRTLKKASELIA